MTIQTVSLSQLVPSKTNPRKGFDARAIEGVAASIRTDGLLHNLVVAPVSGKGKRKSFAVVSGERRLRALRLLEERGELPGDFSIPVEVRQGLSRDETLRIATVDGKWHSCCEQTRSAVVIEDCRERQERQHRVPKRSLHGSTKSGRQRGTCQRRQDRRSEIKSARRRGTLDYRLEEEMGSRQEA